VKNKKTPEQIEKERWQKPLLKDAKRVATNLCNDINQTVPASVLGMPYARQYVLEKAIQILQDSV
jgi:hypothetical protein